MITPDGRRAISASVDKTLKVWELSTGRVVGALRGRAGSVRAVAVTPDGRHVVYAVENTSFSLADKTLNLWDFESGAVRSLGTNAHSFSDLVVTPDGQHVVSSHWGIEVWNLLTGDEVRSLKGHSSYVNAVALGDEGTIAISASEDGTLKIWNLWSGKELGTMLGNSASVAGVAIAQDASLAASASYDNTLRIWDLAFTCSEQPYPETISPLASFTCDAGARSCAFVGSENIIVGDAAGRLYFLKVEQRSVKSRRALIN